MPGTLLTYAVLGLSALGLATRSIAGTNGHGTEGNEAGYRAPRQAPDRFDPTAVTRSVLIEDWAIREFAAPTREVIVGTVRGHPHVADGRRMHTTELIWIDERLGWARSLFRFYRLGRRATSSQTPSNSNER